MNDAEYRKLALRTECSQQDALQRLIDNDYSLNPFLVRLMHSAIGCGSEAGEFLSLIQDYVYYGKPIDKTKILKELGDIVWYINQACDELGVDISTLKVSNIAKLEARYPDKFSEYRADRSFRNESEEDKAIDKRLEDPKL